ncbi:hypothetical protein [Caulobacter phage Cr30]|uniref:hypothetical protein n=1 Tax=Caulobacter phage Cr30 TaxID=1357714 RepID=UPI0004A9B4B5|nr:hypothetical protein OZ74_gp080 [Caulobacter phage Cr30]AGS80965.1 hypothetical protein [Caulobacter phage Cr30]
MRITTREDLKNFGCAPGEYWFKCYDCNENAIGAKLSLRCQVCATNLFDLHEELDREWVESMKGID